MSQTRADLHFKQALVLIEEQLLYISLNGEPCRGQHTPSKQAGGDVTHKASSFTRNMFHWQFKILFNICLFVFISFTLVHTLVIFFLPPTINLISQTSSRSFFSSSIPPLPVQAEMREGLRRKGEEEELKQDARIKCALTVFDCFCTIFSEWI